MVKLNGIRARIALGVILILVLTLFPVAFLLVKDARNRSLEHIEDKAAIDLAHVVAMVRDTPPDNFVRIQRFVKTVCEDPEVVYCKVYGPTGYPIAEHGAEFMIGENVKRVEKKVVRDGRIMGTVLLGVNTDGVESRTQYAMFETSVMVLVILFAVGIIIRLFLDRFFVVPVVNLSRIASDIGRRRFEEIPESTRSDEIGDLERAVNLASQRIKRFYNELEDKVEERTRDVKTSNIQLRDEILERARIQTRLSATLEELSKTNRLLVKARDKAEKASRSKSCFMAMMSHEIRTPMNTILGMADMLDGTGLSEEQGYYLRKLRTSGDKLLGVIDDILNMVNIETSRLELSEIPFSPVRIVDNIFHGLHKAAQTKGIELKYDFAETVPEMVSGDAELVVKVLSCIISNAVKFTSKGEVKVLVENEGSSEGKINLLFVIRDTGVGIPEDKRNMIFESFTQIDSSCSREFGGTGLGLAISARLVNLMGGRIWCESQVDSGSIFYIALAFNEHPVSD